MVGDDNLPSRSDYITVHNALSYKDLLFCQSMPLHPGVRTMQFALFLTVLFVIGAVIGGMALSDPAFPAIAGGFFLFYLLVYPLMVLVNYQIHKKRFEASITLTEERIKVRAASGAESDLEWRNVSMISKRHGAVVLRISRKPDTFYWIPFKRFASPVEADCFYEKAKEYWENLRHSLPIQIQEKESELPANGRRIVADLTLKELIAVDYYLLSSLVVLGLLGFVYAFYQAFFQAEIVTAVISGAWGLFMLSMPFVGARIKYKNHPEWMQARTTITPEFFESTTEIGGTDNRIVWSTIKKIWTWNKNILFKLETGRTVVIPMRCFSSESEAMEFVKLANEYWLNSQKKLTSVNAPARNP